MVGLVEGVALELLRGDGAIVIWRLHEAAGTAHLLGNDAAAERLLQLADAAEAIERQSAERAGSSKPLRVKLSYGESKERHVG